MSKCKNWPYAYHNLQESLKELIPHLQRNKLNEPQPFNKYIDLKVTPDQLGQCINILSADKASMKESESLECKVTKMLIDRFIIDGQYFKDTLDHEIEASGLASPLSEINT